MAPLPENNTARLFVEYTSNGQEHVAQVRLAGAADITAAVTAYNALKGPMANLLLTTDRVSGARFAAQGSNLSFPLAVSPQTGTLSATADKDMTPRFISWTGRGGTGRRARFTLFTQVGDTATDGYRDLSPGTLAAAMGTALASVAVGSVDISGQPVNWNSYINLGENAYFQRKQRRTNAHI